MGDNDFYASIPWVGWALKALAAWFLQIFSKWTIVSLQALYFSVELSLVSDGKRYQSIKGFQIVKPPL